jgi:branched-chain amino acid aminotransferase
MSTAYVNDRFIPFAEAALPLDDPGVVWGAIITDRFRTFRGVPFRADEHIARFRRSCDLARVPLTATADELRSVAAEFVRRDYGGGDLSVIFLATPGPTLIVHTAPVPSDRVARLWRDGIRLQIHEAARGAPAGIKHRSRLGWWMANRTIQTSDPDAEPLLYDPTIDSVLETPTANLLAVIDGTLTTPPTDRVLPGISMQTTIGLADELGLPIAERPISFQQLRAASEVFVTNSTFCLAPAARVNDCGFPTTGPVLTRLWAEWGRLVGVEIGRPAS